MNKVVNEINLIKNNEKREIEDYEWIQEFFDFLKGVVPDKIYFGKHSVPKLTDKKAEAIIYYLQEKLPVFPDHIERCWNCGCFFDDWKEGLYWETKERHYCGNCSHLVPENYDRGKR